MQQTIIPEPNNWGQIISAVIGAIGLIIATIIGLRKK